MALKIVGRTPDEGRYLLVDESVPFGEPAAAGTDARILDTEAGVLHAPQPFHSATAHVPSFEEYDADDGELDELLRGVRIDGPPATEIGDSSEFGFGDS